MRNTIYLDYNATTPCDPEVVDAMLPYFRDNFGNASSQGHSYGWLASDALEKSSYVIANALNVSPNQIIYTSGATESINTILKGVFNHKLNKKNHIITVETEHKAVLDVCQNLEKKGARITYLKVDENGIISLDELKKKINSNTLMVAIMFANNETGVLQPIESISEICKKHSSLFFSDATQALGKISLGSFFSLVDFACFSSHKIYGPKGMGMIFIKKTDEINWESFVQGGGQQRKLRGGTYNIPGIVGFSKAIELNLKEIEKFANKTEKLRNYMEELLLKIEGAKVNSRGFDRLPNTLNVSFSHVDGEQLLNVLGQHIAVSNGSACNSASINPSHVLSAMGIESSRALASMRISLGKHNTLNDTKKAVNHIVKSVAKVRNNNILWKKNNPIIVRE
jgi:cysteine desulfurase